MKGIAGRIVLRYLICLLTMVIVGALSCINQDVFHQILAGWLGLFPLKDASRTFLVSHYKVGHSVLYGLLTLVFFYSLKNRQYLLAPLLAFAFGLSMELIQFLLPTRASAWTDLGYNLAGIRGGYGVAGRGPRSA